MGSILATGVLKKRYDDAASRNLFYTIGYLSEKHLPLIMRLQEVIVQNLGRKDLLQPFSSEFMKQHMGRQGVVLGAFVRNRLIAFRNIYYPSPDDKEWNLGLDLEFAQEQLSTVANLQMVCVHPRFRGNGIALKMNQVALGLLLEKGIHSNVCATVSPYNIWNIRILLRSGFCIRKLKSKYGGKLRYIVHQNLRSPCRFDERSAVKVRLTDLETQEKWFAAGFCAVSLCQRTGLHWNSPSDGYDLVFKAPAWEPAVSMDSTTIAWQAGTDETNTISLPA